MICCRLVQKEFEIEKIPTTCDEALPAPYLIIEGDFVYFSDMDLRDVLCFLDHTKYQVLVERDLCGIRVRALYAAEMSRTRVVELLRDAFEYLRAMDYAERDEPVCILITYRNRFEVHAMEFGEVEEWFRYRFGISEGGSEGRSEEPWYERLKKYL